MQALPVQGSLRVVTNSELDRQEKEESRLRAEAKRQAELPSMAQTGLANHIRTEYEKFRRHRDGSSGFSERLIKALRAFNGEYSPDKLMAIKQFGGSEVYARIIAMKCRGASSLLRDVYLAPDRPWALQPPADPDVPAGVIATIKQLISAEMQNVIQHGAQISDEMVRDRENHLLDRAKEAARKQAKLQAKRAQDKLDEILEEGRFYKALAEFIVDLPLFPFACIKGPVVIIEPKVRWVDGAPVVTESPKMYWKRVSPFDIFFTPGVSDIEDADIIERSRLTRAEINDLLDLPGYNHDAVRAVLDEYGRGGLADNWDGYESERADQEHRENPLWNQSNLITCLEYTGNVQGRMLLDVGIDKEKIPDPMRDYMCKAWLIGNHIIKAQISPSPRKRHEYFITSFEKVPGTPVGNALPDILEDIQEVCNASLRSLVNNMSIASGPQVVINVDRLEADEDAENMYPWKRWRMKSDPMSNNNQDPVSFFQPQSISRELIGVYKSFSDIGDEISAIPKYMAGQDAGGAGRTASGLAMLMNNSAKILQTVAANIDRDVIHPLLITLYDIIMLTDPAGTLQGNEEIRVMGVNVAQQRETQRARQLEFLQITANPLDQQIVGLKGRAAVLRSVGSTIGLDGDEIVPSNEDLESMEQQQKMAAQAMQQQAAQAQGDQKSSNVTGDTGPRTNIAGGPQ